MLQSGKLWLCAQISDEVKIKTWQVLQILQLNRTMRSNDEEIFLWHLLRITRVIVLFKSSHPKWQKKITHSFETEWNCIKCSAKHRVELIDNIHNSFQEN